MDTQPLPTYVLSKDETLVGRSGDCTICINDKRLSNKHCTIKKGDSEITITDLSTNGTFIASKKIGKNVTVNLKHLDEVWLLTVSKVPVKEAIGFRFELFSAKEEEKKKQEEKEKENEKEKEEREKREIEEKKRR